MLIAQVFCRGFGSENRETRLAKTRYDTAARPANPAWVVQSICSRGRGARRRRGTSITKDGMYFPDEFAPVSPQAVTPD